MKLYMFFNSWEYPVANDHYGGDGSRVKTRRWC